MSPTATGLIGRALRVLVGVSLMTVRELGRQQKRHEAGQHHHGRSDREQTQLPSPPSVRWRRRGTTVSGTALAAAENKPPIPGALGMLYDSTLCIGCQACGGVPAPQRQPGQSGWGSNLVQQRQAEPLHQQHHSVWKSGTGEHKDQLVDGYAYIKQCMHCVDPNCVSVCPVQALIKDPKTGIVHYDLDVCTGCRYCMVGCPFDVPKYDYDNPFGAIHKCELCNQKGLSGIDQGKLPGCVEVRPTGAVIFGTREALMAEPGAGCWPPRAANMPTRARLSAPVIPTCTRCPTTSLVYGEKGGTQVLVLAGCPTPSSTCLTCRSSPPGHASSTSSTPLPGMVLPLVVLTGLSVLIRRNTRHHRDGDDASHGQSRVMTRIGRQDP